MLLTLETIGNWNPQLFREIKGRFNFRNVALVAGTSLLGQFLLLAMILDPYGTHPFSIYQDGWLNIFRSLNLILPISLVFGGAYMLISDMANEQRRGTLNFIRLTPQSSQTILIGKMLGVPVLIYLATALTLPLHLWAASSAAVPLSLVFIFYLMVVAICGFFYSTALFYIMLGGLPPWIGTLLVIILAYPALIMLNLFVGMATDRIINLDFSWFYLPLNSTLAIALFTLLSICSGTYWIWQLLNRRFNNPIATIASKTQSYLLVTCVNLWILGFSLPQINSDSSFNFTLGFTFAFLLLPFGFLILIAALSPHRQALQDWARYRGDRKNKKKGRKTIFSAFPFVLQDLILGEKSPALVAIAINLAIAAAIWIPWILLLPQNIGFPVLLKNKAILALLLNANLVLICAAIAQLMLFLMKTEKPKLWAATAVSAVIILPLATITFHNNPYWSLISVVAAIAIQKASTTAIFLTILGQWSVLALLSLQLTRQLRKIGESNSKSLLAVRPSLPASSN